MTTTHDMHPDVQALEIHPTWERWERIYTTDSRNELYLDSPSRIRMLEIGFENGWML